MRKLSWFYYCFEWYIQQVEASTLKWWSWFYYCFEWYIQPGTINQVRPDVGFIIVLNGISNGSHYAADWSVVGFIIVLNGISNCTSTIIKALPVGFIIVLNGISNYKVACDDVRMGVDNRAFFY